MIVRTVLAAGAALVLAGLITGARALAQSSPEARTVASAAYSGPQGREILIDVRDPAEWRDTSMPAGAIGISISRPDFVEAVTTATGGDRSRPVALICRSGTRSLRAAKALTEAGFTNVTNIGDGMVGRDGVGPGWLASGLPLQRPPAEGS
jgi:rhodanese-related sulfurtransferase